ncbi:hypothetical protein [Prauserella cavernicola]|uniref:Uncharacterized protein n=1 Tax=Prauserella cavernicola TaxID=2800127 RepID=A0A934QP61_9PSEU|nr:hypothetical protein [Prauserella cavernicola]MBK1783587.1 hypothetical protein [Prauserella cavernicola]
MRKPGLFVGAVVALIGCGALAVWALATSGLFDGPVAEKLRVSSVYVAPEVDVDEAAAERIIGNRALTVAFVGPGTDLSRVCDDTGNATGGTVLVPISAGEDDYETYACDRISDEVGTSSTVEALTVRGIDEFLDEPLEALKVMTVNYDLLVKAEVVPDGARVITLSLPRYLLAAAAIGAVVFGSTIVYLGARRVGRFTAARRESRDAAHDSRRVLSAGAAALAQQIIELDGSYSRLRRRVKSSTASKKERSFVARYPTLVGDYTRLLAKLAKANESSTAALIDKVQVMNRRARNLAEIVDRTTSSNGR